MRISDWSSDVCSSDLNPQRIALQPVAAFIREVAVMPAEMIDQRPAPGVAGFGIAQRIEIERHRFVDAKFIQQLRGKGQQLDIGGWFACPQYFGVELVELAETALLRPLVTKQRTPGGQLQRRPLLPRSEEHTT